MFWLILHKTYDYDDKITYNYDDKIKITFLKDVQKLLGCKITPDK